MTTLLSLTTWQPFRTLMVMPRGAAHSVWWSWRPDGDFEGWYVNLERLVNRWAGGVDVYDQELDLLLYPDGRWSWKDEDAFAEYTGDPAFWDEAEAAQVRAEGERLLALARSGAAPFDSQWTDFQPDPAWRPTLMPHWWELPADATCWGPSTSSPDPTSENPRSSRPIVWGPTGGGSAGGSPRRGHGPPRQSP